MKERKLFLCCLSFLLISFLLVHFAGAYFLEELKISEIEQEIPPGNNVIITGQVYRKEKASDYQILYLKNISVTYQKKSIQESKIIIYDSNQNTDIKIGNRIQCTGAVDYFESATNPGNFDRKFYYQKQNIHAYMWADVIDIADIVDGADSEEFVLRNMLCELRERWSTYLLETMGEKNGGILCAMLLGEKAFMDTGVKELYQLNGIAHILAISGLHLSFIGHGFYQMVRRTSGSYLVGGIAGLLFMSLYILMIGMSVSALRAVVMFVLRVIADMSGRVYDPLTAVSLAAVLVILWRPLSFYDGGFQLSFGAIVGILFVNPLIVGALRLGGRVEGKTLTQVTPQNSFFGNLVSGIGNLLSGIKKCSFDFCVSSLLANFSIQLLTLPVLLYHYYEFPLYSFLLNMIVVPMMSVVLFLALAGSVVGMVPLGIVSMAGMSSAQVSGGFCWSSDVLRKLGEILLRCCSTIFDGYEWLCEQALQIPSGRIVTGQPTFLGITLYYLLVAGFVGLLVLAKKKAKPWMLAVVLTGCLSLFVSCPFVSHKGLEVTMLDVGQGDCIFLREKDFACLIDGGSSSVKSLGKYRIESFLKCKGVQSLDCVFVSHGDQDHISGIQEMLERQKEGVEIEYLVLPVECVWDEPLLELARTAKTNGTKVVVMKAGESIGYGESKIECLYPAYVTDANKENDSEGNVGVASGDDSVEVGNASSMVLDVTYGELDMLFTGDVEGAGEEAVCKLLDKQYEVLKVAHHGSKNSSSEEFLEKVNPMIGLISAGKDNSYGHPHDETLERLEKVGSKIFSTQESGAITIRADGERFWVEEYREKGE